MLKFPLIALASLAGGTALAQAPAAPSQQNTRAEVQKIADTRFGEGDVNNDGFLSREELQNLTAKATQNVVAQMEQQFTAMDTDKNGKVSPAEFRSPVLATFDRVDTNKDGVVTQDEARKSATQR